MMPTESTLKIKDKIQIYAPSWPKDFEKEILKKTLGQKIIESEQLKIEKID